MALGFKEVGEIIRLLDQSTLDEFVIEVGDLRIEVRRRGAGGFPPLSSPAPASIVPAVQATPGGVPSTVVSEPSSAAVPATATEVRSPMVGTFHRRPDPSRAPFVELGQSVAAGDPLCLVEVMKLFTTIPAPCAGTVVQIAVDNGAMVEYDQLLLRIEPG